MVNEDFSIFARDPVLTSLRDLQAADLNSGLAPHIPSALLDAPLHQYRITNMRYSPRQKLVIGLNTKTGATPIALRIFPRESLRNRLAKARRTHPEHTFLIDDLSAIAWVFPGERKLDLDLLANRSRLSEVLQEHRGYRLVKLRLVHFVPEHTLTACVHGRRDDGSEVCEYLKIYYNDNGATTSHVMRQLTGQLAGTRIRIPGSVCYLPDERLLIQSALARDDARTLGDSTVAKSLAEIHSLHACAPRRGVDDTATGDEKILNLVANTFPAHLDVIRRISGDIRDALQDSAPAEAVLLHGDAHLGNLFPLLDGGIGVIDLDKMCWGPPEEDLASFFAFKIWLQLRRCHRVDALLDKFPQFLQAYNRKAHQPVSVRRAYIVLAHKMISERIRRGIVRGKLSDANELLGFVNLAGKCLVAAGQTRA